MPRGVAWVAGWDSCTTKKSCTKTLPNILYLSAMNYNLLACAFISPIRQEI